MTEKTKETKETKERKLTRIEELCKDTLHTPGRVEVGLKNENENEKNEKNEESSMSEVFSQEVLNSLNTRKKVEKSSESDLASEFDRIAQEAGSEANDLPIEQETSQRPVSMSIPPEFQLGSVDQSEPTIPLEIQEDLHKYENKTTFGLNYEKRKDKQTKAKVDLFGWKSAWNFAIDRKVARRAFMQREAKKPRWAVWACVVLRDEGLCRVCSDPVYTKKGMKREFGVEQLVLTRDGGQFSEPNCVLLCGECCKAWNKNKGFIFGLNFEEEWHKMRLYVMKRRRKGINGSKNLSSKAEIKQYELMRGLERLELKREMIAGTVMEKIENDERDLGELMASVDMSVEKQEERVRLKWEHDYEEAVRENEEWNRKIGLKVFY